MPHSKVYRLLTRWITTAIATTATAAFPSSGFACRMLVAPDLHDVRYADVVVIGRIENYQIIRDEAFRKRMLAAPRLTGEMRKIYSNPKQGLISDYARFDIRVEEVLVGQTSNKLSATWDNSTFLEPEGMGSGRYLIALRRADSNIPPLRGPSATILPTPEPDLLTLVQAPCSSALIYEADGDQARAIRQILQTGSQDALGDFLRTIVPRIPSSE